MEDMAASVIARLKNKARKSGKPLQLYMQLFCQEEFLRRLALSEYADNLVLKGGLFIYTRTNFESRATIDIDFLLRRLPCGVEDIQKIIDEVLAVNTGNGFIILESKGFGQISPQRKYHGVSFQIIGIIKNTKTPFNVDIGVGDIIIPKAEKRRIPVQLPEFSAPEISTYSLESTIAEKFDTILQRLEMTSRMKDYYDIWYLTNTFDFDGRKLQEAIEQTLRTRGTPYNRNSLTHIASFADDESIRKRWRQFLNRTKLPALDFSDVLYGIQIFLLPVFEAIIQENECLKSWDAKELVWR